MSNLFDEATPKQTHAHRRGPGRLIGFGLILLMVASCTNANAPSLAVTTPTPAPSLAPTPTPSPSLIPLATPSSTPLPVCYPHCNEAPTPTPLPPVTEDQLVAACTGVPIPGAAKYVSGVHPLVVVAATDSSWELDGWADNLAYTYPINNQWWGDLWTGPIQLVVCVEAQKAVKVSSCGNYKRDSDGKVGAVVRYKYSETIRVVVAQTGKALQSTTAYGTIPSCAKSFPDPGANPPWRVYGNDVESSKINNYVKSVSTQKVK